MQLGKSEDHYSRGSNLLKLLTEWCHSLSHDVNAQRRDKIKYAALHTSDIMVCKHSSYMHAVTLFNTNFINVGHNMHVAIYDNCDAT